MPCVAAACRRGACTRGSARPAARVWLCLGLQRELSEPRAVLLVLSAVRLLLEAIGLSISAAMFLVLLLQIAYFCL